MATGTSAHTIATQYGLTQPNVSAHFRNHVTERFKRMCKASHNTSFNELVEKATEANGETIDILNLLIRGHSQQWTIALERGEDWKMSIHAGKVLAAMELRSRVTLELQPEARNVTVNNYLMRDAAGLVGVLRDHPDAVADIESWYQRRIERSKTIDHAGD